MSSHINPITLPIATIQHDFQSVIIDVREGTIPSEDFWISCYKQQEPSVHGKVRAELDESDRTQVRLQYRDGVEIYGQDSYSIACPQLGIPRTKIGLPTRMFSISNPRRVPITAFDISPDGSQFTTGYNDGSITLQSATAAAAAGFQNTSKPHITSLTSLRFFPSSRVLLTAGADFSLAIVPAEPIPSESPLPVARSLKGHTRSITDTAIISRGRNVLSCAKDGTLRLWDVSGGNSIRTIGSNLWCPISSICLGNKGPINYGPHDPDGHPSFATQVDANPKEVDTLDKVVFCALSDGSLEAFDLGTKLSVHRTIVGSRALTAVSHSSDHNLIATGSIDGIVTIYDTRSLSTPVTSFTRNSSSIEDLAFTNTATGSGGGDDVGVVVATEDGLPYVASILPEGPAVSSELVGSDCEAIRVVRVTPGGMEIWTAGDDGIVRRY